MTKREHAELQKFFNLISKYEEESTDAFQKLQELNGTIGSGNRWCCAQENALELLKHGVNKMYLYDRYVAANAKVDALRELGSVLCELNFWK